MAKKKSKKPPRPKLRPWFPKRGPTWLKLEPARLAWVGGLFFATCTMLIYSIRQLAGFSMTLQDIVEGVALTFLVSYSGTGVFVWYMLYLAETELDPRQTAGHSERAHGLGHDYEHLHENGQDQETAPGAELPAENHETDEIEELR